MPGVKRSAEDMDTEGSRKRVKLTGSRSAVAAPVPVTQVAAQHVSQLDNEAMKPAMQTMDQHTALVAVYQREHDTLRQSLTCKICERLFYEPYILSCGHTYCYSCISQWFKSNAKKPCPSCRVQIKHSPAPAFVIKDMVSVFIRTAELLPDGETVEMHQKWQEEEAAILQKDRDGHAVFKGMFGGLKRVGPRPIRDPADGINRCSVCHWEIESGWCNNCGVEVDEDGGPYVSDPDSESDTTDSYENWSEQEPPDEARDYVNAVFTRQLPYPTNGIRQQDYDVIHDRWREREDRQRHRERGLASGAVRPDGRPRDSGPDPDFPDPDAPEVDWYDEDDSAAFPGYDDAGLPVGAYDDSEEDEDEDDEDDSEGSLRDFLDDQAQEEDEEPDSADDTVDRTYSENDTSPVQVQPRRPVGRFRRAILDDDEDEDDEVQYQGTVAGGPANSAVHTIFDSSPEDARTSRDDRTTHAIDHDSGGPDDEDQSGPEWGEDSGESSETDSEPEVMSSRHSSSHRPRAIPTIGVEDSEDENEDEDDDSHGEDEEDNGFSPLQERNAHSDDQEDDDDSPNEEDEEAGFSPLQEGSALSDEHDYDEDDSDGDGDF